MHIHHLSENNSLLNHFLMQIRAVSIQNNKFLFRNNMKRIGEIMAYEISKTLAYQPINITTPLGIKNSYCIENQLILCSILRAGLTLHDGFMNYFDEAENGFIAAYRHHYKNDDAFEILVEYQAMPSVASKTVLLIDPMLATGQSIVAVLNKILATENPSELHIAVAIAAPEGIAYLEENLPENVHLWIAAIDEKLNAKNYIVPGIGDAGDLAYGEKL